MVWISYTLSFDDNLTRKVKEFHHLMFYLLGNKLSTNVYSSVQDIQWPLLIRVWAESKYVCSSVHDIWRALLIRVYTKIIWFPSKLIKHILFSTQSQQEVKYINLLKHNSNIRHIRKSTKLSKWDDPLGNDSFWYTFLSCYEISLLPTIKFFSL